MGMESLFNLAWMLVAMASFGFWLKRGQRTSNGRRSSLLGLAMLVVILFPVISVSDDLWSAQNPAETDSSYRRVQSAGQTQKHFPVAAALPELIGAELNFEFLRMEVPRIAQSTAAINPAFEFIENRPPPVF